ncbi:glycoside hydrolase family 43 protein [Polymorphobacter fuscus]|uniref:glycoside hydrolase family 43 protein n=1 Tax=Sandarakinorhabdus fusca TaxID=1439888 RepID=UPI0018847094|nr:glycoside hydrolase family 43 protein [Polymorphobacter fuscus]
MARSAIILALAALLAAPVVAAPARFAWFEYRGTDGPPAASGQYRNPILAGFYPDPSITRVGSDFYLVNSTFSWFPGIPVFHSRDLVHWRQIGNAIDRPGQLDFKSLAISRGVFAPDIAHHDGRFFIVNTCVDCGGNFVITATDPAGPWSDPAWLPTVEGIDPGLFFDDDGSAWLVNNREPVGGSKYAGHRAIWIEGFDPKTLKMRGNPRMIVDGGVDPSKKPIWIEGPHIYKKNGAYFLVAAEGGTSVNHSQVVLRADTVTGPYVPAPAGINPILTQRDLPADRPDPVSAAGHAGLVDLPDGGWWSVFLGTRPYAADFYNIGRETFLLPVDWSGTWPISLPRGTAVPRLAPVPPLPPAPGAPPTTGTFTARDDFDGPGLGREWMSMRAPNHRLGGGDLLLEPTSTGIGDFGRPAFVARRQQHSNAVATTEIRFTPGEGQAAGLAALQNDEFFLTVAVTRQGGRPLVRVARRAGASDPRDGVTIGAVPLAAAGPVQLRITARGGRYDFAYRSGKDWVDVARDVDATNLSTARAGGFVGTMIGPFAVGR